MFFHFLEAVADKMKEQVNGVIKKARVHQLLDLSSELKTEHILKQLNTRHRVIPEQIKDGYLQGHTRDYVLVRVYGPEDLIGKEINVLLKTYDGKYCYGDLV